MKLLCSQHKRKCDYICLNIDCHQSSKNIAICSQCVLNGKHKNHQVADLFSFIDQIHNTINTELNLKQYELQIENEIQQQIEKMTKFLIKQCENIKQYLRKLYQSYLRDKLNSSDNLNKLQFISEQLNLDSSANQGENGQEQIEYDTNFTQFERQQLINMYTGKTSIDQIVQRAQRELEKIVKAVNHIISDQFIFDGFVHSFQENAANQINDQFSLDINVKSSLTSQNRQNNLTLDGKYCFCQIDYKHLLIACQGTIKLVDIHTKSIKHIFPFIQLRQGFDIEVQRVHNRPGYFYYYNIGQSIVEMRSIYQNKFQKVFKFDFSVTSCTISHSIMYIGTSEGKIFIYNTETNKMLYSINLDLIEIIISLELLSPQILLAGQIEDSEMGIRSVIDIPSQSIIKQITHLPVIQLENYNMELIKINQFQFICSFGELKKYTLNPFEDVLLSKYSFEWEIYHDCQIYKNRYILLKEIDFIIVYDILQDKPITQIRISQFLMSKVIGLYLIDNTIVMISDRGKIEFQTIPQNNQLD